MELKDLDLTDNDFKLIIDGLDALPHKHLASDMTKDLMSAMLPGRLREHVEKDLEKQKRERERSKEILIEDIKILQGKLLMLKRYLIEKDALKQVNDLLK